MPIRFLVRSLEQCIDIFENGPRPGPLQLLSMKIQAYALEKVLGDFERAVGIRRALICKSSLVCH